MEPMLPLEIPTLHEAIGRIRAGTLSASELWQACSEQIDRLNPQLNAILTRIEPGSDLESEPRGVRGDEVPALAGCPVAVKDLFETSGVRTTAGSLFFKDYVPVRDEIGRAHV